MKIDIRTEKREGGVLWFTPYRRIFPFIWTQWFRHPNGVNKIAICTDDLDTVKEFIREQDKLGPETMQDAFNDLNDAINMLAKALFEPIVEYILRLLKK